MESLSQLLEEELAQAVEVKDRGSLHRYVVLLTENITQRREQELFNQNFLTEFRETMRAQRVDSDKNLALSIERFKASDQRFDDMNKRFDDVNRRFDDVNKRFDDTNRRFEDSNKRFDDMNKRFTGQQWFIGVGFTVLAALMSLYQVL